MSRYIDADEYIKNNACCGYLGEISVEEFNRVTHTANVRENVHGEWIPNSPFTGNCSECGASGNLKDNFCSNCGADMRE